MKHDTVRVGGMRMDYCVFGEGSRTLVIIPGLSVNKVTGPVEMLAGIYERFVKDFTVYMFDRRDEVGERYSIEEMADDTVRAMDALGLGSACFIGYSQGGMIVQAIAVKYPERTEKLLLGSTMARPNPTMRESIGGWIDMAARGDDLALTEDMVRRIYTDEARINSSLTFFRENRPDAAALKRFKVIAESIPAFDLYDRLDAITCPVLVIGAVHDRVLSGAASEEIAEKLGCGLYMYEEYGHAVYDEAPDYMARVLAFMLVRVPGSINPITAVRSGRT